MPVIMFYIFFLFQVGKTIGIFKSYTAEIMQTYSKRQEILSSLVRFRSLRQGVHSKSLSTPWESLKFYWINWSAFLVVSGMCV